MLPTVDVVNEGWGERENLNDCVQEARVAHVIHTGGKGACAQPFHGDTDVGERDHLAFHFFFYVCGGGARVWGSEHSSRGVAYV